MKVQTRWGNHGRGPPATHLLSCWHYAFKSAREQKGLVMLRNLLFKMVCPPHYKYLAFFVYPKDIRVSGAHSSHLFRQVSGPGFTWPRITGWVHRGSFYPVSLTIWLLYQGKLYSRITYAGQHPLHLPLTAVSASVWLEPLAASTDLSASSRSGNVVAVSLMQHPKALHVSAFVLHWFCCSNLSVFFR